MRFLAKLSITLVAIIFCTQVGKKFPSLGGLIAAMPLNSNSNYANGVIGYLAKIRIAAK